jgi:lipopolysaccharide transport system ATP-binding protein
MFPEGLKNGAEFRRYGPVKMKRIVRVTNVGKQYRIGARQEAYSTLRDTMTRALRSPLSHLRENGRGDSETVWALKDINFEADQGECLGIIGRNGAGKSTLLKILSRITEPTLGRAELFGRVGSLLEVGTGFHPELTGRENIFLNGAVLGMRRSEITLKFDEIVAFAEIDKFLDTPVKHYSSGMYMRLAFAVSAHLEPEILLVDEVLAVGDTEFQAKCLGKMGAVAREGRTVLFVSHNMAAVQALCQRVLWLDEGVIADDGSTDRVVKHYLGAGESVLAAESVWDVPEEAPGNEKVRVHRLVVRPLNGSVSDLITTETPFVMEFEYWNLESQARLNLSLVLQNEQGLTIFNTFPIRESQWHGKPFPVGLFRSSCYIPAGLLNDGLHRVWLLVVKNQSEVIFSFENAIVFNVVDSVERRGSWYGKWTGAVRPNLKWDTEFLQETVNLQ